MTASLLRASDADRERTATLLREHCVAGRLTVEDLDRRVTSAYAAPRRLAFIRGDGLRVTVLLLGDEGGTDRSAFGEAPRAIRRAFARLSD